MFDLHYTTKNNNITFKQTFESKEDLDREIEIFSTSKELLSLWAFDKQGKLIVQFDK